ncbi:hypothetical protein M8C21_033561, partial [Ambrosia artemisiifolia]
RRKEKKNRGEEKIKKRITDSRKLNWRRWVERERDGDTIPAKNHVVADHTSAREPSQNQDRKTGSGTVGAVTQGMVVRSQVLVTVVPRDDRFTGFAGTGDGVYTPASPMLLDALEVDDVETSKMEEKLTLQFGAVKTLRSRRNVRLVKDLLYAGFRELQRLKKKIKQTCPNKLFSAEEHDFFFAQRYVQCILLYKFKFIVCCIGLLSH